MSVIIDLVLVLIIASSIFNGYRRGFIKTVIKMFSVAISFVVAYLFSPALSHFFYNKIYYNSIKETIYDKISDMVNVHGTDALFSDSGSSFSAFEKLLKSFGSSIDSAKETFNQTSSEPISEFCSSLAEKLAGPIAETISYITAFIVLFILSIIALSILSKVIGIVTKLPIIKTADKLLGTVAGILFALINAALLTAIFSFAAPYITAVNAEFFPADTLENTVVFNFLYNLNLIKKAFEYAVPSIVSII